MDRDERAQRFKLGIDIGGTFTDIVILGESSGKVYNGKCLSTPQDLSKGVIEIFDRMLRELQIGPEQVTAAIHGTTVATNAIIEKKGAKTALLTTRGFRDVLEIGRELRYDLYDLYIQMPEPLVPRYLRREINERLDKDGNVLIEMEPDDILRVIYDFEKEGITALAISFLHAYANPGHERKASEIIKGNCPELSISLSSDVACEMREFERTSTTVTNAYLQPLMEGYLDRLETGLQNIGYKGRLFIMMSNGGISDTDTVKRFPVRMIESGPAAGALAAGFFGNLIKDENLLSFDMGGTTAKMCVIHQGKPLFSKELEAARVHRFKKGSGLPLKIPSIELIEIGAGGGSIASVDAMGLLKVGPESAGADPGPACYGQGGEDPTVTDADLVLGFLDPEYFLGGQMKLDKTSSLKSMGSISSLLKVDPVELSAGIFEVVNENMATATRVHMAELGMDPREFSMIAFGGAGPVHGCQVAGKIGLKRVIAPLGAGTLSALGVLVAAPALDFTQPYVSRLDDIDWGRLNAIYRDMERKGIEVLNRAGVKGEEVIFKRTADMRYVGQGYEISVPIPDGTLISQDSKRIEDSFWQEYNRLYGRHLTNVAVEGVTWRLWAYGPNPEINLEGIQKPTGGWGENALKGTRKVYFPEEKGFIETRVYDRYALRPGDKIRGPAIVEERESTVVAGPESLCSVDRFGNLIIERS
jgi:N-methylhydantoinase A